jgi:hypothetical protein
MLICLSFHFQVRQNSIEREKNLTFKMRKSNDKISCQILVDLRIKCVDIIENILQIQK